MVSGAHRFLWLAFAVGGLGSGCATSPPPAQVPTNRSFAAYQDAEIETERQAFIISKQKQLHEVNDEIGRLDAKLAYEATYANAHQRAEWTQRLWELRQRQEKLTAEVDRASKASPLEWREMRGTLGVAIDTLQANANKIGDDISGWFHSPPPAKRDSKLCPLDVPAAKAAVSTAADQVALTVVTTDTAALPSLRSGAEKLSSMRAYSSMDRGKDTMVTIPVHVSFATVTDGVAIQFTPDDTSQLSTLMALIQQDAATLGTGSCPAPAPPGA